MSSEAISDLVRLDEGLISRKIFFDHDIYKQELERIFGKCWLFLAHESQLPKPGDYVTNYMAEDPVVVCRGDDAKIRVFLNSCRHRGMKVCRTDSGNASEFQCSFHGWTYANTGGLLGVPFFREAYGGRLNKESLGLRQVPRVAIYGGLIFACWDEAAVELDAYLGDLRWYLDIFLERHIGGLELIPGQQRYKLAANWKIAGENFVGDSYHLYHSHGSMYDLDILSVNPINSVKHRKGNVFHNVSFDGGHGLNQLELTGRRYEIDRILAREMGPEVVEYVDECHNRLVKLLSRSQSSIYALSFGNVFPNFSMNDFSALRPTGLYLWHPRGPAALESWQWSVVDADAPQTVKDLCRIEFTRTQSITGIAAQDDTENFESVTEAAAGLFGRKLDFNYQMNIENGLGSLNKGYPGRFAPNISETNQRTFYDCWSSLMNRHE
jgi:dibenzofuran dioxygenase subunit alpha